MNVEDKKAAAEEKKEAAAEKKEAAAVVAADKKEAAAAAKAAADEPKTMRIRFRHGYKHFQAGSVITVTEEEGWPIVNAGHADCDPAPGVAGQPFPPPEVTEEPEPPPTPARGVPHPGKKVEPGRKNEPPMGETEPKPAHGHK